ncbi:MAG TPA: NADH-quinone oxidoreductase subunit A, partial [Acidimicrobiaceae bacterium]|nr:NADH-quinone oxidoreductase subunit A [Acidimicrobiaceae bacterium]
MIEYSDFVRQYLTVAIFAGVGIGLGAGLLGIGKIFRPTRPQEQKYLVYES